MKLETLQTLASRVRHGDPLAACELREALESPLARIVRRALRPGTTANPVVRMIRDEVGHLAEQGEPEDDLAREVSNSLVGRLRYGPARRNFARDTVVA
jgi:hypothetical protein